MMTSPEPSKIKVVFLVFYYEAWDSLAGVHDLLLSDAQSDVSVISIPRRFSLEAGFGEESEVSAYFDRHGVKHLRFNYEDSFEGLAKIKELAPDYVFINYPWQRNYQPGYRVEELSEFAKVCYVPYYSAPLVVERDHEGVAPHLYKQRSHQLASLIFTQDKSVHLAYAETDRGNEHVYLTGTPKIDALVNKVSHGDKSWPLANPGNFKMMWAPHHSYSPAWLNFGNFAAMFQDMLTFATANPTVDVLLRPHPLMFRTLLDREVIPVAVLEEWLEQWNALPNTAIDADDDVALLFGAADLMITDGISFLAEYPLATNKPGIFFENAGHWVLSELGELAASANIRASNFVEFEAAFRAVHINGLPDFSKQIAALRTVAQPYPGDAAKLIVDIVKNDYLAETPLVDKSLVTEIAWENQPGTEAAWD
jgi:hypothetical protein